MSLNKIESIKKLKKKGMYEITINGDEYSVTEDLIVKYTLIKGKELTDTELSIVKSEIENENFKFARSMLYNGRRPGIKDDIGFQQGSQSNVKLNAPRNCLIL